MEHRLSAVDNSISAACSSRSPAQVVTARRNSPSLVPTRYVKLYPPQLIVHRGTDTRLQPTDPAIYIPNNYNGFNTLTYTAPGGPTATCAPAGSNPTPVVSSTSTARATTTPVVTSSSTARVTSTTVPVATPTATGPTVSKYGQCGGIGYTGNTVCVAGSTCTKANDYYSQCL